MTNEVVMIFVKNPKLGKVKSRLARTLGEEKALEIYKHILLHTAGICKPLAADKVVFYADFIEKTDVFDNAVFKKQVQVANPDLGARMEAAFRWAHKQGYKRMVLIGSDCYELTTEIIQQSLDVLEDHSFSLGRATDGGYYLLGMNMLYTPFFINKQWSTSAVYSETLTDMWKSGKNYALLPMLNDVDEERDLTPELRRLIE